MSVRVRFAPSPTGQVHIGNIRAAIFNWLYARHEGGRFLLRVEDTDRERSTPEALRALLESMEWLGLNYDETPMYQSTRTAAHLAAAEDLIRKGAAYRENKEGKGECIMFRMPGTDMAFHDEIKGDLHKGAEHMKDFVIVRSDGAPVFHLANVVDDVEMKITLVMRGDDHIENTYRHVAMFRALGAEPPKYAHLPMIVNQQGKPYSKRDGAAFVGEFRENGFLAHALFNYLALLGWSPGGDREKMSRDEMVSLFTLDRVKNGPAQVDMKKLTHLNGLYVAELPAEEFVNMARARLAGQGWATGADDGLFRRVSAMMQTRTKLLTHVLDWKYFFSDDFVLDEKAVQKELKKPGSGPALAGLVRALEGSDFSAPAVERALRQAEKDAGLAEGKLNQVARVATTGVTTGAGIYETLALLGRDVSLRRLTKAEEGMCGS
jgi:glutamyl-tRNA synthetase